jgi:lipoprotein-anchoring transpeptidase ErfK/SrfK
MSRARIAVASLAAAALVAGGCGGATSRVGGQMNVAHVLAAQVKRCVAGSSYRLGNKRDAYAAVVRKHARAYRRPGRRPFARFAHLNVNGVPTVFGIRRAVVGRGCAPRWYYVQLPIRPNGVTGYVRAGDIVVGHVTTRISIDLSRRRLTFFRAGRRVLDIPVAIGAPATPTPSGRFYVNQRLIPTDPSGPYGPGALGISAFSNVLTGWAQGGPIAIHGTNRPASIGRAVSNGCVRVRNPILRRLFAQTFSGTPVVVHP